MEETNIIVESEEFIYDTIAIDENGENITYEETIEVVDTDQIAAIVVDSEQAFTALGEGNESLNHALMHNRDIPDQHPIAAITGLRDELNEIERLKTVYSNEINAANYYKWNEGAYDEHGYFVSLVTHSTNIEICSGSDIFGVTVDVAGFVGNQNVDVTAPRKKDNTYALVATSGLVDVRCESTVAEGDYVVSNAHGMATKTTSGCGYKVVAVNDDRAHDPGVLYATIALDVQACTIDALGKNLSYLETRVGNNEINIVAAMNVANAAYNKAGEVGEISEDALKNALEAMNKANDAIEDIDKMDKLLTSTNEVAVQAKAIAESAVNSAETIRNEAVATANESLASVNDLIEELEPIASWQDTETGNVGAEYLTTYIKDGLATKVEVQTVENLTNENKSAIEKNATSFQTLVSSIDKYSVGEYSQAYGLTQEQASSILTKGMIYIPTKHKDQDSHSETYSDTGEENYFTPHNHYVWDGTDWIEYTSTVAFYSEEPVPSNVLQYWYLDSNEAPDGYEAHVLYINQDGIWTKVNILEGNTSNRITSMIKQTAEGIALEVTNARGSAATLGTRLTDTEATVNSTASWVKGTATDGDKLLNVATIDQSADGDGSSLALVVADKEGNKVLKGASIVLGQGDEDSYINVEADNISLTGKQINISTDGASIDAKDGDLAISSTNFSVDTSGNITANGGIIGGLTIQNSKVYTVNQWTKTNTDGTINRVAYTAGISPQYANASGHKIFLWAGFCRDWAGESEFGWADGIFGNSDWNYAYNWITGVNGNPAPFYVTHTGELHATNAYITGRITATSGTIGGCSISSDGKLQVANANIGSLSVEKLTAGSNSNAITLSNATITGVLTAKEGGSLGSFTVAKGSHGYYYLSGTGGGWTFNIDPAAGGDANNNVLNFKNSAGTSYFKLSGTGIITCQGIIADGSQFGTNSSMGYWKPNGGTLYCQGQREGSDNPSQQKYVGFTSTYLKVGTTGVSSSVLWSDLVSGVSALSTESDERVKKDIEVLSDDYEVLFDLLQPKRYKYINGTSDRYHTGYIAQEVVEALEQSNLDTQQFAAVMLKNQGTDEECWHLRRDEFVALNTWQIQKAKARITELEDRVSKLEALIKEN